MKAILKRLETLDCELTPKQIVLKCLSAMAEHNDYDSFMTWTWSEAYQRWVDRLYLYKAEKLKKLSKGDNLERINRLYAKAQQQYVYLYTLAFASSQHLEMERFNYLQQMNASAHLRKKIFNEGSVQELLTLVKSLEALLIETRAAQLTEQVISEQYFDSMPLFLVQQKAFLKETIDMLTQARESCRQRFVSVHPNQHGLILGSEWIEAEVQRQSILRIELFCFASKMAVYESVGKEREVVQFFQNAFDPLG